MKATSSSFASVPEHVSDLVETFRGAAIDESSPATVSLRFDATGPFAVSPRASCALAEALRAPPLVGRVSELWLDQCWLGREGWSTLAPVAREGADAFTSIRAVGDEIDEVAAAHVAVTLEKCTNLRNRCVSRETPWVTPARKRSHRDWRRAPGSDIFHRLALRDWRPSAPQLSLGLASRPR